MNILVDAIIIIAVIFIAFMTMKYGEKRWWDKFEKSPHNFPFRHHGRVIWYSRSCAVAAFIFCKNTLGEWCVLANQRGKGAPDYNFFWSAPCGYVDFSESCEDAAIRETEEEMSICLPKDKLQFHYLNSDPKDSNHQNITARYFMKIEDKTTDDPSLEPKINEDEGERDEVAAVAWIPVANLKEYNWAFGHKKIIEEIFDSQIGM